MTSPLSTDEFDYALAPSFIAQVAAEPRDTARLLVDAAQGVQHRRVADLPLLLREGDVVVVNDTRVIPARIRFVRSSGGSGEVLLLDERDEGWWSALVRPSAKLPPGTVVEVGEGLAIEIGEDFGSGLRLVRPLAAEGLPAALDQHGEMPLPPYLGQAILDDPDRYQTVYSRRAASAAAPTAGLHFTDATLDAIAARGVQVVRLELVVGLDTFRSIEADDVTDHVMHSEGYRVPVATWEAVARADRVVAIGTTTVRALEAAAATGELDGRTDLFIRRGFDWKVVDALLTNFHMPRSSLLVMIDAFVGPRWRDLYELALDEGYRFLSFGDAMFVERAAR